MAVYILSLMTEGWPLSYELLALSAQLVGARTDRMSMQIDEHQHIRVVVDRPFHLQVLLVDVCLWLFVLCSRLIGVAMDTGLACGSLEASDWGHNAAKIIAHPVDW
jgi:hypothetical protein